MNNLEKTNINPLISIITPALNLEKYIERCIKSVVNQTYKNFEFFIVDNGSTDSTTKIVEDYAKKDSRIKLIKCPTRGVSIARNLALQQLSGEYVCFIDGDDVVDPNYINDLYLNLTTNDSDMSICYYKRQKHIKPLKHKKNYKTTRMDNLEAIKRTICDKGFNGVVWGKLFKTKLLGDIKFDESLSFSEDLLFCVEYLYKCKTVTYFPKKLYNYFVCPNGTVMSKFNEKKLSCLTSLDKVIEISTDKEIITCAKAWKSILCIMLMYFYHRDKMKDSKIKDYLLKIFYENKKYVKQNKYIRPLYKNNIDFVGFVIKHW